MPSQHVFPLEEGLDHLRAHRLDRAIVSFRAALAREPNRFAAVRGWVTACVLGDDPKSAREIIANFVADHSMVAEGWQLAAQLEWKLGARKEALDVLRGGLKRLPHSPTLRRQMAMFLAAEGKAEEAKHQMPEAKIHVAPPGDADWLDEIATDAVLLEAILSASEAEATSLTANSRRMLTALADKLAILLQSQPAYADRQLLLARVRAAIDDTTGALISVDRALHLNPKLIQAHRLKAKLLAQAGEFGAAIEMLRQLLKQGLPWPDLHYDLAALEREKGQLASARSHLDSRGLPKPPIHASQRTSGPYGGVKKTVIPKPEP